MNIAPRRSGFTLLEMLISVAIFSGLVILILSIFVRTASSQARVNVLREKSEVARSAMSRITNDFQYLFTEPVTVVDGQNRTPVDGFALPGGGGDDVVFVLKYPNRTDQELVYKRYESQPIGSDRLRSLTVQEIRGCRLSNGEIRLQSCSGHRDGEVKRSILPEGFYLDDIRDTQTPFTGRVTNRTDRGSGTGYLKVALTIRPSEDYRSFLCMNSNVPTGHCYKVETVLTAGGLR